MSEVEPPVGASVLTAGWGPTIDYDQASRSEFLQEVSLDVVSDDYAHDLYAWPDDGSGGPHEDESWDWFKYFFCTSGSAVKSPCSNVSSFFHSICVAASLPFNPLSIRVLSWPCLVYEMSTKTYEFWMCYLFSHVLLTIFLQPWVRDTGGPVYDSNGKLVGIVSFGDHHVCMTQLPYCYTSVPAMRNWILTHTGIEL